MELVARYLRMVKRYLPAAERDDIVAELAANFDAEIEDRESALGRPLSDAECEAILNAHGHPIAVALRYRPAGQSFTFGAELVGPALFPFYVRVLAANVLVACAIAGVAGFYNIPTWVGAPNILSHLLLQFAIVTIVFAALQRYLGSSRYWSLRKKTDAHAGTRRVSRMESISTLVFLVISNLWLADVVRSSNLFEPEAGGSIVLTPVWHQIVLPYVAIVALELVRNGVNLVRPEMVRFRALMIASANVVALVAIVILLRAGSLVAAVNPADSQQVAAAHAIGVGIIVALIATAVGSAVVIAWQIRRIAILRKTSILAAAVVSAIAFASFGFDPSSAAATTSPPPSSIAGRCAQGVGNFVPGSSSPQWNGWGANLSQSRFQPAAMAGLAADRVPNLKLQWTFGFRGAGRAYGQPTVLGGRVFVGSENGLRWKASHPGCDGRAGCSPAQSAAVTAIPGIVFSGGLDGHLRAYAVADGAIVWDMDTERDFDTVNGVPAHGGSLDGPGATISGGTLYVNSGYAFLGSPRGNVLLAFRASSR